MKPMKKHCAFTLVEIITVIAIIATLAALVLPALSAARGKAKLTTCASHIRQMLVAVQLYAGDHDDYFPFGLPRIWAGRSSSVPLDLRANAATAPFVEDQLLRYGCTEDLFRCPADSNVLQSTNARSSYAFRLRSFLEPKKLSDYAEPSIFPLIHDKTWFHHESWNASGKLSVGYLDGHVAYATHYSVELFMDQ